jgi:UDPglucose 6-dehydrogenase
MFNTLADKRICLLVLLSKPTPVDTRESPAIELQKVTGRKSKSFDNRPAGLENANHELAHVIMQKERANITLTEDPYKAAKDCDAIAVMTNGNIQKVKFQTHIYCNE